MGCLMEEVGVGEFAHVLGVGLPVSGYPQACRLKPPRVVEVVAELHTLCTFSAAA